ncbi:ERF family protein [Pontibacter sp. BT731]|uniref:ERF family protein n=1 Tax=Pontibacter coccineus TaxID=3063328 RepID=UPI0026E29049|nr:ERF family protein [Pontibacter sp. BT731]MDO6389042.1 ERF family protein [Pontibacter sp. BT731]
MKEVKTETKLYTKLLEIQKRIMGLGKDKSAYGYKYVTGDKVLEHLKPLMNEFGVILKQEVLSIENVRQDYNTKNGTTSEINSKVMMKFTWIDCETGEKDENLFGANGQNAWDKGVGSALTYGERYFLLKFFHIATDEDDIDNPERKPQEAPQQAQPVKTAQAKPAPEKAPQNPAHAVIDPNAPGSLTQVQRENIQALLLYPEVDQKTKVNTSLKLPKLSEEGARIAVDYLLKLINKNGGQVIWQDDRVAKPSKAVA